MENEVKKYNYLTDAQKVMLCVGFLKGLVQGQKYVASVDVEAVRELIAELQK